MELSLAFLTGLFSSVHCVGMCGAIVLAYSGHIPPQERSVLTGSTYHFSYNAGRVLSYVLLGGVAGALGGGIVALQGAGSWFSLASGILMILAGLFLLRLVPSSVLEGSGAGVLLKFYQATFGALVAVPKIESKFYLGLLTPLLPCGLLYAMALKAASTGSAIQGAAIMGMFGLGIVPSLIATGLAGSWLSARVRVHGERIAAALIVLMGVILVLRGIGVPMFGGRGHAH